MGPIRAMKTSGKKEINSPLSMIEDTKVIQFLNRNYFLVKIYFREILFPEIDIIFWFDLN